MTDLELKIRLTLYTAMLYNIPDGLKRLSYSCDETTVRLLAIFESLPREYQRDCVYSISGELGSHFENPLTCEVDVVVEVTGDKEFNLEHQLFARYDAEQY